MVKPPAPWEDSWGKGVRGRGRWKGGWRRGVWGFSEDLRGRAEACPLDTQQPEERKVHIREGARPLGLGSGPPGPAGAEPPLLGGGRVGGPGL